MSIPTDLQEGSLQNLALCMNSAVGIMQQLEKEKTITDVLARKLLIVSICNITIAICSTGQCVIRDISTESIIRAN